MVPSPFSPAAKLEASPAESFLSVPGELYPSLFACSPSSQAMSPAADILSPVSLVFGMSDDGLGHSSTDPANLDDLADDDVDADVDADIDVDADVDVDVRKKTKKRKSWGQVLPEPKTCLPPRKRAKTADEKEQRRVERVLRNRRAAQSSRERKRLEVEALEIRNMELESMLQDAHKTNMMLIQELNKLRRDPAAVARSSSPMQATLSPGLFQGSHVGSGSSNEFAGPFPDLGAELDTMVDLGRAQRASSSVHPVSLSPRLIPSTSTTAAPAATIRTALSTTTLALAPVPTPAPAFTSPISTTIASATTTLADLVAHHDQTPCTNATDERLATVASDMTQRPAVMLCDLQCHQSEATSPLPMSSRSPQTHLFLWMILWQQLWLLLTTSPASRLAASQTQACCWTKSTATYSPRSRPTRSSTWRQIISSATRPFPPLTFPSFSMTSSTRPSSRPTRLRPHTQPHRRHRHPHHNNKNTRDKSSSSARTATSAHSTLGARLLRTLLTCSPNLARPILDATMEALRFASDGCGPPPVSAPLRPSWPMHDRLPPRLMLRLALTLGLRPGLVDYPPGIPGAGRPTRQTLLALLVALKSTGER